MECQGLHVEGRHNGPALKQVGVVADLHIASANSGLGHHWIADESQADADPCCAGKPAHMDCVAGLEISLWGIDYTQAAMSHAH